MYHNSSQKKFWTFENEECLEKLRFQSNQKFRSKVLGSGKVRKNVLHTFTTLLFSVIVLDTLPVSIQPPLIFLRFDN